MNPEPHAMSAASTPSSRLARLLSLLELDPSNDLLRKDVARAAFEAGAWTRARAVIDAGLALHPHDGGLHALGGFALLQAGRHEDAVQAFEAALAHGHDRPELRYNLAFALFMQGRHARALAQLEPAAIVQALPLALLLRARCRHHLGQAEAARADCEAALARPAPEPADEAGANAADAHGLLALLHLELGARDAAACHAQVAVGANPRQVEGLLVLASLQQDAGDAAAARAAFERVLEADPACGRGWLGLALAEMDGLHLDAAARAAEQAARFMPMHVGTWHVKGWLRILDGDASGAGRAFEAALALAPAFADTHGGLAVVAALQGREAEARDAIRRARRLDPQALSARYAQLVLLQRAGDDAGARALFEEFLGQPAPGRSVPWRALLARHAARAQHGGPLLH